ncbi:MAG TPA: hypothetical protein VJ997_13450 [Longimicrobiales bacterium]|nr:hypothetical protein [Longimicrobiales bacterium]
MTRRELLRALASGGAGLAALCGLPPAARASGARAPRRAGPEDHPDPRPGIDASGVISAESLRADGYGDDVVEVFDMVRQIPGIADGLACYCGCMLMGNRSLLTCYHEGGMARGCPICQGEGRLAWGRWKEGQSLAQIRRAIDARFDV